MKRTMTILLFTVLLLTACGASAPSVAYEESMPAAGAPMMDKSLPTEVEVQSYNASANAPAAAQERIVIQNADLAIVVADPQARMLEIGAMAKRLGGFVVSSNMSQVNVGDNVRVPDGSISIRVPAENLDAALTEIKANTIEVQNENRSGEDVTDRYVDLQSQLKAKEAAAEKLYEIMDQTQKAEDTLMVFNQLTQVQSEIEVLKGQIKYYEQASALSAISVRLIAQETIQPITIAGWQPQGIARDAIQALVKFFQGFAEFLIWLVIYIIPVAAVIIVVMAVLWRLLRWFWRKVFPARKTPPAPPAPTAS